MRFDARVSPLNNAQYQIWLGAQTPGMDGLYPLSALLRFGGALPPEALEHAALLLREQAEALRLRVRTGPDGPVQYAPPDPDTSIQRRSFAGAAELNAYFEARAREPIPLDGPLSGMEVLTAPGENALLLRVHHLAADGAGMLLLCERFCALCAGETPPAPPSFLAYSAAHPARPDREDEAGRAFWRTRLEGAAADVKPRGGAVLSGLEADWWEFPQGVERSRRIRGFAAASGLTPYTVFLAAYALWIARVGGTQDVTVLVPRLGRDTEEARHTPGMFTLAVPVRANVDGKASFLELCRAVRQAGREAAAHKDYGLSAILSDLEGRGAAGPLSNFTLSYLALDFDRHGLSFTLETRFAWAMTNLLTIYLMDWGAEGFVLKCDTRRDYWAAGEPEGIAGQLAHLLDQAAERPDAPTSSLELLTGGEKRALGALLRRKPACAMQARNLHGLFRRQASRTPDAPALYCADGDSTYAALDRVSHNVCQNLLALGAGPEDVVAFLLPRTSFIPALMLGAWKAGCAFLPMDCTWPNARRRFVLEDSGARFFVTTEKTEVPAGCQWLSPEVLRTAPQAVLPEPEVEPGGLAYLIYTSGTTGKPKGVLLEHRGLLNLVQPGSNPFNADLAEHGRAIVAVGSIAFDISIFEIFVPLLNGVAVVLADENGMRDPEALAGLITDHGANILHCTPSRLLSYLEIPVFRSAMAGVDMVLSAGEAFTRPLLSALRRATSARLYNGYGPTETTIGATIGPVEDDLTIGAPIAGSAVYILDAQQRLLPAGATGEIAVGGAGVARGYLNRPELTAEKFLDWSDGPVRDRIYRTGDLGWCLPDGRLYYAGRRDDQVKLRGLRIELGEIEHCVENFPGVRQCAALVKKVEGREHLLCYYSADTRYDSAALKEYAANFLTGYMVPDYFRYLEDLPHTANGKIDRNALSALEVRVERSYAPPRSDTERKLCAVFSQVLDGVRVGAEDSFFDLGGTSLLAARVVLLARQQGVAVEYGELYRCPTPRALAGFLEGKGAAAPEQAEAPEEDAPCTPTEAARLRDVLSANRNYRPGLRPLGNILLTGATGFLGIHILRELLERTDSAIYCLVRPKGNLTADKRLRGSLFYYFEENFAELFGTRLFTVQGDLLKPGVAELPEGTKIDTVIHCAADVSHFGTGGAIRRTNVEGTANLAAFCQARGAALVHVSTMSVGGFIPADLAELGVSLSEQRLWIRQDLSNEYLRSKFDAELRLLLETERGLRVKIMRVGNLQGRISDGEFQMNNATNGFTKLLQSMVKTGRCPASLARSAVNFSPVDAVSRAIRLLAGSDPAYTVFHIFDSNDLPVSDLIDILRELGHPVEVLPDEEFDAFLLSAAEAGLDGDALSGFLTRVSGGRLAEAPCESGFSLLALEREGFRWPEITRDYLRTYLSGLDSLGFFE